MRAALQQLCADGAIRPLDLHIGLFLEQLSDREKGTPELLLAATLASAAVGNGHVCFPLDRGGEFCQDIDPELIPEVKQWRKILLGLSVVGQPDETRPLILDEANRLYLYRFFNYEQELARDLLDRANVVTEVEDIELARQLLSQLFAENKSKQNQPDFQQLAAAMALLKPLLVISGGPGTGKTYTVARILALLQGLQPQGLPLNIGLAAPTGKAAARLEESIRKAKGDLPPQLAALVPEKAKTLHRLLGYRPGADDFRYNHSHPLQLDLLVLDEASMIDVELMAGVIRALPPTTRLILLGDHNQLASVEAGSLFGDLCGSGEPGWSEPLCQQLEQLSGTSLDCAAAISVTSMADSVIKLRTGYRFKGESGIGQLAEAVNSGSMERVKKVIGRGFPDLYTVSHTGGKRKKWLQEQIIQGFQPMLTALGIEDAFTAMEQFRFLCAVRRGPNGVETINQLAAQTLRQQDLIRGDSNWFQGKPIIIRRNHYEMQLFNGDTGLLWNDSTGRLMAWFRRADNSLYPVTPTRLPEHDAAFAITIHKAQGSEFARLLLLLPEEESRVLSRELIYTGITRAGRELIFCTQETILSLAVRQRTIRYSGLAEKLWSS